LPKNKKFKSKILKNENKHEKIYLSLNASLAKKHLKWKQKYSLKEGVNSTMNWYVNYLKNSNKIIDLSLSEIENFYKK
jgi:dTDP-D-glucose 4,6-dehydratase